MEIADGFLRKDPDVWHLDKEYDAALKIVAGLKVVNDVAERGVAFIQELDQHITHYEEQNQFLLQVVAHHCKQFPDSKKSTVVASLR